MAYANSDKEKDDEQSVEGQGQGQAIGPEGGAATISGAGASANASAGGAPAPAQAASPSGSGPSPGGNFVGIKQYLDANKPQSQKLAGNVGGYVNDLSQKARDTIPGQTTAYNQAVDQNTVNLDQNLFNEAKNNTVGVANDANKRTAFQAQRDATYKGPQDFQSSEYYKPTEQAFNKATTAGQNTLTEQGQRDLLNQYQQDKTGKTSGMGVTNFDQMLLQSGGGKETLAKAREGQGDFKGLLEQAQMASQAKAKQAQDTTAQTKAAVQNEFGSGTSSQQVLQNQLNQRAQQQINQAKQQQDAVKQTLQQGGELNDAQLQSVGLSRDDYKAIREKAQMAQVQQTGGGLSFGGAIGPEYDFSQYLHPVDPSTQINAQNVANADEYARYQALNQLMGTNNSFLSNQGLANTANPNTGKFDVANALGSIVMPAANATGPDAAAKALANALNGGGSSSSGSGGMSPYEQAAFVLNPVAFGANGGGANVGGAQLGGALGKALSDKRQKKDISPFNASEFLDSLGRS